jgi:hypothetical protein
MNRQVHLLYFEGCPNVGQARRLLEETCRRIGREPQWIELDTSAPNCPARWRGFPSPTILVEGTEVLSGRKTSPGTASCRFAELPSVAEIISRLEGAGVAPALSPSLLFSIPWCCVLPAALSALGLGSAVAARLAAWKLNPLFFILAALFLGRAHYLLYWKRHGSAWSRRLTWGATVLALALWIPRAVWILR